MRRRAGRELIRACLALFFCLAAPAGASEAVFLGSHVWHASNHGYGGFSGLEMSADGTHFTAISDRAGIVSGLLIRDAKGRIEAVETGPVGPLLDQDGQDQSQNGGDSEGLAIGIPIRLLDKPALGCNALVKLQQAKARCE